MTSSARGRRKFSTGDPVLKVIAISKGCGEECQNDPTLNTQKLVDLAKLIESGALLAYSQDLYDEIFRAPDTLHLSLVNSLFMRAHTHGNLLPLEDLPVFVEDGIETEPFASVDMLIIQLFEAENSRQWEKLLLLGKLKAGTKEVRVIPLSNVGPHLIENEIIIQEGDPIEVVRSLLSVPMSWSQRIVLIDQYALKNDMVAVNQRKISGLDRFIRHLVEVRRRSGTRLHRLDLITNNSPRMDTKYVPKRDQLSAMQEICDRNSLHEWVDEINLIFSKKSLGRRFIAFENSNAGKWYRFGEKGLDGIKANHPGDQIQEQFEVSGPLKQKVWQPYKDTIKSLERNVIEIAS